MAKIKPKAPSRLPNTNPTRSSRQSTCMKSFERTSPSAKARVTVVAAWLPVLPPVPVSSGINSESTTAAARVSSKESKTLTVSNAETASTKSQTMRERTNFSSGVDIYGCCSASVPPERAESSVSSSSTMSAASSHVKIPTRRVDSSTIGIARKSSGINQRAVSSASSCA